MVDDGDFEWLNQWVWHAWKGVRGCWYARRSTFDIITKAVGAVYMHRAIAAHAGLLKVDHRDGDGLNNRRENLRPCSHKNNCRNQGIRKNNTSGFKGVHWDKKKKKWLASIMVDRRSHFLGYFKTPLDCAKAYNAGALKYHGEFARLNDLSKYEKTQEPTTIPA